MLLRELPPPQLVCPPAVLALASSSLSLSLLSLNGDPLDSIFAHYQCLPSSIFVCYVNYIKKCSTGEN